MITLRSALPTPKEAWKNTARLVRTTKKFGREYMTRVLKEYTLEWERRYNIDAQLFDYDYVLPCIHIYYYDM